MRAVRRLMLCLGLFGAVVVLESVGLNAQPHAVVEDSTAFFEAVRQNLARSGQVQYEFAYKERRTELHTNPFGRLGTGADLLYEVHPLTDGATGYTRRLLQRDGQPVSDAKVERVERRPRETPRSSRSMEDVMSVLEFEIDRREVVDARPFVVVRFTPRDDAKPTTRQGRLARAFVGEVFVDEREQEVRRVEATAVDSISYGFGLIARLGKGTKVTLTREPVAGDVWMPTAIRFQGEGRALLFRKLNVDYEVEWFEYRRVPGAAG